MNQYKLMKVKLKTTSLKRIKVYHTMRKSDIAWIYAHLLIEFSNKHQFSLQELQLIIDVANNFQVIYESLSD